MGKVDFSREIFSTLAEGEKLPAKVDDTYQFPLWDILKEIDRRARRAERDKGRDVRGYMGTHPAEVERIRKKHGL